TDGVTYTADTLEFLAESLAPDTELFFITGADAVLDILSWKDPRRVLSLCTLIAATRPGYDLERLAEVVDQLGPDFSLVGPDPRIRVMEVPALAISSSMIRERLASGNGWAVLLPGFCPETSSRLLYPPQPDLASVATGCDGSLLRVEIRTRADCEAQMQIVPPRDGKPLRCVVDLYPSGEPGQGQAGSAEAGAHGAASPPSSPQPAVPAAPVVAEPLPRKTGPWRILIDPGHGGHDPGAQRKGIREKEVVLDVARRLEKILDGTPDFEAKLTRADDRFVGLVQRRKEAETYQADAFISIHVNAAKASKAIGVEVFFLSLRGASDQASSELARLENEADPDWVVEEDSQLQDLPFGFDLRQSDTILRSSRLAEAVLDRLDRSNLAASRGVKQAGFAVLKSFQVPSILVETGFLSNPGEAKRLQDPAHRQKLAECIAQGTIEYFQHSARSRAAASESDP
ncbi:MAG: N-acetylmuramoyl-L-alanine amidase, partial [Candidatus Eisenbacteria bacterium]